MNSLAPLLLFIPIVYIAAMAGGLYGIMKLSRPWRILIYLVLVAANLFIQYSFVASSFIRSNISFNGKTEEFFTKLAEQLAQGCMFEEFLKPSNSSGGAIWLSAFAFLLLVGGFVSVIPKPRWWTCLTVLAALIISYNIYAFPVYKSEISYYSEQNELRRRACEAVERKRAEGVADALLSEVISVHLKDFTATYENRKEAKESAERILAAINALQPNQAQPPATADDAAVDGDAEALLKLGCAYKKGQGVPRDVKLAEKYLRQAGEKGSGKAWCELGDLYEYAAQADDNIGQAIACYRKAVELDWPHGYAMLGECHLAAYGVQYDAEKALPLLRKGAEAGSYEAMHTLGGCYQEGNGVEPDQNEAKKWHDKSVAIARELAEKGDDVALKYLGDWYASGEGVLKDEKMSRSCYEKAHALGNFAATEYLAFSYMYDEEVPDWEAKTTALFKELADIGYPYAAMELCKLKMGDNLTLGKMDKAQQTEFDSLVKQLETRGEQKDSNAYLELGFIFGDYIIGEQKSVEDFRKAAAPAHRAEEYYRKAAALGHRSAFYHLGIMFIVTDHDKAIEYLETAAVRGDMDALGALCVGDVVVLSMMKTDAAKVLGGQEKLDAFLSNCARHLKRREKYGMDKPVYESDDGFGNIPEGMTFAQLLSKLKEIANSGNTFVRQVLEQYEKLP